MQKRADINAVRMLSFSGNTMDFASNDYLGFATNPDIFKRATSILQEKDVIGNGATGSRLLTGNTALYLDLETLLTEIHGVPAALVFNSGYDANIGFFSSVPQRGDTIFYDELIHASIRDGIQMGNAKSYKFGHNDLKDLKEKVDRLYRGQLKDKGTEIYIVTEAVFSMDGDMPDLVTLVHFCKENGYHLIVDEAHAVGVFGINGEGLVQELGLSDNIFARIVTFGKAMGCHGAAILGSEALKQYLVNFARSFIYTTGLPPHSLATVLAAYDYLMAPKGKAEHEKLRGNIDFFLEQLKEHGLQDDFIQSNSAIHCCIVKGNSRVKAIAKKMNMNGFDVKPIMSPTVTEGRERLRFCLHSGTEKETIKRILSKLSNYYMR